MEKIMVISLIFQFTFFNCSAQRIPMHQTLSLIEANELLKNPKFNAKPAAKKLMKYFEADSVYFLKDNYFLFFFENYAMRIDSDSVHNRIVANEKGLLQKDNLNSFAINIDKNAQQFIDIFGSAAEYNFTVNSLIILDNNYERITESGISESELFIPISSYISKILINITNGRLVIDSTISGANIFIIGENGIRYDAYSNVRAIVVNQHHAYSFFSLVNSQLSK